MSSLVAKANTGTGTDSLAGFSVPDGFAGAVVPVDESGNIVSLATAARQDTSNTSLASIDGKFPSMLSVTPDSTAGANPVRLTSSPIWTCSFAGVGASYLSSDFTLRTSGTGVGYSQAGGSLLVTTGTTTNAEWLARSTTSWKGTLALRFSTVLSQRIANQNFAVLLADSIGEGLACTINSATSITVTKNGHGFDATNVGQFMFVGGIVGAAGVPGRYAIASTTANTITFTVAGWPASGSCTVDLFGWNHVKHLYNGTNASALAFDAQRKGWASGDTTATTNTSASPGHIGQTVLAGRDIYFDDALRASGTAPLYATRASRYENIPDESVPLYVYLWVYNGTTAPASTTTLTVGFLSVEPFVNQDVMLRGARQQGSQAPIPVVINSGNGSTVSVGVNAGTNAIGDIGVQYRANATGAATVAKVVAAASTNATVVKASAGRVVGGWLGNTTASWVYLKFHNSATTPTAGAAVYAPIPIPPNGTVPLHTTGGAGFTTGIAYTTVTGAADADATAVAANAIIGTILYA